MRSILKYFLVTIIWFFSFPVTAQDGWKLVKDKNDIKVYTRATEDSKIKSYKGEAFLKADINDVLEILTDVGNSTEWIYQCIECRIINKESDTALVYYSVFDTPWPFQDRDVVLHLIVKQDYEHDSIILEYTGLDGYVEEYKKRVRIPEYYEVTTLTKVSNDLVKMTMEGYTDPGGSLPAWLINMFLSDGPYESILEMKIMLGEVVN